MTVAHLIQDIDERGILLAVDMLQLNGHIVYLLQGLRAKEVGSVVIGLQHPLILGCHHWCQLCQVTNHQQLHTTKGLVMLTEAAQHGIDGIQQVSTHHRDLIDNEQIHRGNDLPLLATEVKLTLNLCARHIGRERQLEEGVDGDTAGIDGSHTRWRHYDGAFP